MEKKLVKSITGGIVAAAVLGFTTMVSAVPTMTISDGINAVITVEDNGVGDVNPSIGAISYSGSVGDWSLAVGIGQTKPFLGSATAPHLDLGWVVTSTSAGTITIQWSDTDFASVNGYSAQIGGTMAGNGSYSAYGDTGNTLFGTEQLLTTQSFFTTPFSGEQVSGPVGSMPFSLTQVLVVNHGAGNITSSGNALLVTVPDGGATVTLLGSALAGLGLIGTFFKRRQV